TIARTITGFAWGLFLINLITLVSDIYGQDQGPKYAGILQAITTVGMIVSGPIEGAICAINWRLLFAISLPIMVFALILVIITVPKIKPGEGEGAKMDVGGAVFTCVMLVPFSLAMNWGNLYGWTSPLVVTLLVLTVVGLVVLLFVEKKAVAPMYPAKLLKNKYFLIVFIMSFAFSFANGSQMYAPTFAQYVLGINSTLTGFLTLPGLIIATILTAVLGNVAAKKSKYKGMVWLWTILTLISGIILCFVKPLMGMSAMTLYALIMVGQTPLGSANGVQQIVPYTYPMKVLKSEELAVGMSFMGLAGPLGINISNGICGGMMNGSGGLLSLFFVPIVLGVVMLILTFFFKDIKQGETL
ncbi:MAG: MFS transporter, partial [Agathobacter sp.]